jgi:outer membrane immunogenic protein
LGGFPVRVTVLLAAAIAIGVSTAAQADGYEAGSGYGPRYYPTWAGFYIGAHLGGAWGKDNGTVNDPSGFQLTNPFTLHSDGVFGGGQLGYNFQRGNIVFGIEADFGDMDINAKAFNNHIVNAAPFQTTTSGGFYGDVTGRLGYSFGQTLLYAKGGFAFFDGDAKLHSLNGAFPEAGPASGFTGWTVGGGLEAPLSPRWSVKAEYLHFDFGSERSFNPNGIPIAPCCSFDHHLTADTVKLGVNYHFDTGYAPLK